MDRGEMAKLQGRRGYILRLSRTGARLHRVSCPLVRSMNPDKGEGVYHAPSLHEALEWLDRRGVKGRVCGICLQSLTYRPRPERLTGEEAPKD